MKLAARACPTSCPRQSAAAIRVAVVRIESDAEVLAERLNGVAVLGERIAVRYTDDDRLDRAVSSFRRQQRGGERLALAVAQRQENRHDAFDVRLQPDVLLDKGAGWHVGFDGLLPRLAKMLLNGVVHGLRFTRGLRLG